MNGFQGPGTVALLHRELWNWLAQVNDPHTRAGPASLEEDRKLPKVM